MLLILSFLALAENGSDKSYDRRIKIITLWIIQNSLIGAELTDKSKFWSSKIRQQLLLDSELVDFDEVKSASVSLWIIISVTETYFFIRWVEPWKED